MKRLTPRQLEVMTWTAKGKSAADVGQILGISMHTVNFHKKEAMARLGCASQVTACCVLTRDGEISL